MNLKEIIYWVLLVAGVVSGIAMLLLILKTLGVV